MTSEPESNLLNRLQEFISENQLCDRSEWILVAVSGGLDSMVLVDLLIRGQYQIAIAHCNFQMRGKDSDDDEIFVRDLAEMYHVPFHTTRFDTRDYARSEKIGIQESARNLRYTWFSTIMEEHGYHWLATAHHQDDQIETVMMNIARGTGINGLTGMRPSRDHIIRPLLFATRSEIRDYAVAMGIDNREDSSNKDNYYRRNYLRNKLIPKIEKRVPAFKKRMSENILIWQKSARLLHGFLDQVIEMHKKIEGESIFLEVEKIDSSLRDMVTYEWLRPYGFNYSQIVQMMHSLEQGHSGKLFFSRKNRVILDRKKLILSTRKDPVSGAIEIHKTDHPIYLDNGSLQLAILSTTGKGYKENPLTAYLDAQKVEFPLTVRKWQKGDFFYPLGMDGKRQKLKKFFNNHKYSQVDKEQQWLLCSGDRVCWVIGKRIDHHFRTTEETRYTLRIHWTPA